MYYTHCSLLRLYALDLQKNGYFWNIRALFGQFDKLITQKRTIRSNERPSFAFTKTCNLLARMNATFYTHEQTKVSMRKKNAVSRQSKQAFANMTLQNTRVFTTDSSS